MRKTLIFSGIFFVFFAYGLFVSQYDVRIIGDELKLENPPEFYDYRGVTHVHSNRNLGSGDFPTIIGSAQEAGLDFLIITDLNDFSRDLTIEGYHRTLLVSVAGSFSYLDSRILAYDLMRRREFEGMGQSQVLLADLLSQSGEDSKQDLLILAHPFKPGFTWTGSFPTGLDGLEVINLKSVWQRAWINSTASFLWSVLIYPFNPKYALLRLYDEPREETDLWDRLNTRQRTVGMAGNDASARTGSVGNFYFRFPSYYASFGLLSNHVLLTSELTGEANRDRRKIFEALSQGQFYFSLDILGNPKGFSAFIEDGDRILPLGATTRLRKGMKINVRLPQKPRSPFEIVFLKDGVRLLSVNSVNAELPVQEPGVYRVVVRVIPSLPLPDGKRWLSWIYTNAFYIE